MALPTARLTDPYEVQAVPASLLKADTSEPMDGTKEIVAERPLSIRVEAPAVTGWRMEGEFLLTAPSARFVLEFPHTDPKQRPVIAWGATLDKNQSVQFTDAAKGVPELSLGEKASETWLSFSLLRLNGVAELKVGARLIHGAIPAAADRNPRLNLGVKTRLRNVKMATIPLSSPLWTPILLHSTANASLTGPEANLGKGLALSAGAVSEGARMIDDVPFVLSEKVVDVAGSTAGIQEPLRTKWMMWGLAMGKNGRLGAEVPADQYSALRLIAFSRHVGGAVPRMTVRVGWSIMENVPVAVPDILGEAEDAHVLSRQPVKLSDGREGSLFHLRVPLAATGNFWELKGRVKMNVEFSRDVNVHVNHPDPNEFGEFPAGRPSSVVVVAATLEPSPIEVSYQAGERVPIFHDTEKPLLKVSISNRSGRGIRGRAEARCAGPGTMEEGRIDRQEWTVSAPFALQADETKEVALDLTPEPGKRGWYLCSFEAWADDALVQQRETSFAVIAPDTRQAKEDSPFGTWVWTGRTHAVFAPDDQEERLGMICKRGGWRWSVVQGSEKHLLKATCQSAPHGYQRIPGWFDPVAFEKEIVPWLKEASQNGFDNFYKVMHESRSSGGLLLRFSELLGGTPYDMPPDEKQRLDGQFEKVAEYCRAIKKADALAKIVLINDYPAVGVEFMKRGFPKDAVDVFGSEGAMFMREPERQPDWLCLLGTLQQWRRAMEKYGYQDKQLWTTEALYHSTNPGNLTLHKQAVIYVREAMLAMANGVQRLAGQGTPRDYTSDYRWSNWGCTGFCSHDPEYNPKPSFAMFAWLTQALDQAKCAGFVKQTSTSLHILDFVRPDGSHVYPLWVVRGRQNVTLRLQGGVPAVWDNYGNPVDVKPANGALTLEVTDAPAYVTGAIFAGVTALDPVELKNEPGQIVVEFDASETFRTVEERSEVLESNWDYPRVKGRFKTERVTEGETTGLRVELLGDGDPRKLLYRYVELALAEPIVLPGRPHAFTVRLKGNGGWGKIMFELVDATGRVWTSCGNRFRGSANSSDCKGDSFVTFDGWQTMRIPLPGQYPGEDQFVSWPSLCDWWPTHTPEWVKTRQNHEAARAEYPNKLAEYDQRVKEHQEALNAFEEARKQGKAKGNPPQAPAKPAEPQPPEDEGLARVDYPLKLTKLVIAMPPHILYVNTEIPVAKPVIVLDRIGVLQPPERM